MKISKSLLSKIIKEEIKQILYETHQPWEQKIVHLMVQIYQQGQDGNLKNKNEYIKQIESITKEPISKTFEYLKDEDAVDHDMFRYVAGYLLDDKTSNLFSDYSDFQLPASYQDTNPKYKDMNDVRSPYETKSPSTYMRKPKPISPDEQEDTRKNKKNLVH